MNYSRETIAEKNMTLSFEFERYILEHPDLLAQIPPEAEVILLPKDDPELYRINLEAAQKVEYSADAPPLVYIEIEALAPARSRLVNPHLTFRPSPLVSR
ncbi:MAG: hypothetical protein DPW09_42115 [Anaerolineae bacterium]|nr:hypothetical protein [Anaerolineales bacterium]MCQ3980059.1 hypothetical protein [Anaerolineae bacterium]